MDLRFATREEKLCKMLGDGRRGAISARARELGPSGRARRTLEPSTTAAALGPPPATPRDSRGVTPRTMRHPAHAVSFPALGLGWARDDGAEKRAAGARRPRASARPTARPAPRPPSRRRRGALARRPDARAPRGDPRRRPSRRVASRHRRLGAPREGRGRGKYQRSSRAPPPLRARFFHRPPTSAPETARSSRTTTSSTSPSASARPGACSGGTTSSPPTPPGSRGEARRTSRRRRRSSGPTSSRRRWR